MDIDRIIEIVKTLKEEGESGAPTNSVAAGGVAGYDMPLGRQKKSCLAKGKMPGARTRWKRGCK